VRKANRDFGLLRRGDRILVAVSGGKDSGNMLHVLDKMAKRIGNIELIPVFVDEGIKGYRDRAKRQALKLCKMHGLQLKVYSFRDNSGETLDEMIRARNKSRDGKFRGQKACSICGTLRKHILNRAASELGADKVAIGHTMDDVAQTFLMNVLRADIEGIARFSVASPGDSVEAGKAPRIRPLAYVPEEESALYAKIKRIPHLPKRCPYSVEAFRGLAEGFLNGAQKDYPAIKFSLLRACIALSKLLPQEANSAPWRKCGSCGAKAARTKCKACAITAKL
jgi:uncharacterized protein (TIGR00269 family)